MEYTSRRNLYCTGRHAALEDTDLDDGGYESDENANKKPFEYSNDCVAVTVTKVQEKPVSLEVSFSNQSAQHHASSKTWTDVAGFEVSKEKRGEDSHFVFKILLGQRALETRDLWAIPDTNTLALAAQTCKTKLFEWADNHDMLNIDDCSNK